MENVFEKLEKSDNGLQAKNLKPGNYSLRIVRTCVTINIRVFPKKLSTRWNDVSILYNGYLYDRNDSLKYKENPVEL